MKHVGQIKSTGRRCIIVFRYIYDDNGNIIDKNNALVVETDSLPDMEHQDMMRIIESEPAQRTSEMYNVLVRERFSNGANALEHLVRTGRLRKFPSDKIVVTPDSNTRIELSRLNFMAEKIKEGWSESQINQYMTDSQDDTDTAGREMKTPFAQVDPSETQAARDLNESADANAAIDSNVQVPASNTEPGVLSDEDIARQKLNQAKYFSEQADALRKEAYELVPSMKPGKKPGKSTASKGKKTQSNADS